MPARTALLAAAACAACAAMSAAPRDPAPHGLAGFRYAPAVRAAGSPEPPPPYRARRVHPGLKVDYPVQAVFMPFDPKSLWVVHQPSPYAQTTISRFDLSQESPAAETLVPANGDVAYDLAFHPRYPENGYVFVGSNGSRNNGPKRSRVTRHRVTRGAPYRPDPAAAEIVLDWDSDGHNGAALAFANDGTLFVTSGDGTSDSDMNIVGQKPDTMLAKVLRIDVDRPTAQKLYSVPADNPFVNTPPFVPETWAYGMRNPWRASVDPVSGDLWVGNNGQDAWEQAYRVSRGANYGWSVKEGSHDFYRDRPRGPTPISPPAVERHHADFRSLTGGHVYRGKRFPELVGAYLYGDYSTGKVWAAKHDGQRLLWDREIADTALQISAFVVDPDGEILILDHHPGGGLYALEPTPPEAAEAAKRFPRRLSETGLFASVPGHTLDAGVVPYGVNAPFWSDGADKARAFALPPGGKVGFKERNGWDFPDGSVTLKSFALGEGDARRWVETRLMLKADGEWQGFSYRWNADQTDADLVPAAGTDVEVALGAGRSQKWHYPSRAECMVCHTRAANFTLGLCSAQMDREHAYPSGVREHQFVALERAGLFREPPKREGYTALADPHDAAQPLEKRARSYLHSNCAACHVPAGGGNAGMDLDIHTDLDKAGVLNEKPRHQDFGLADARLVAPGKPASSVLQHRMSHRGPGHMPPLSTHRADGRGARLLAEWIGQLR